MTDYEPTKPPQAARAAREPRAEQNDTAKIKAILSKTVSIENHEKGLAYLQSRGITLDIAKRFNLRCISKFYIKNAKGKLATCEMLIIPKGDAAFVARNMNPCEQADKIRRKGKDAPIFNVDALSADVPFVFVVEGEIDALSIEQCGYSAVSIPVSYVWHLIDHVKNHKPTATLFLSMDNDRAGQNANAELAQMLDKLKIEYRIVNICGTYKDPNERLTRDKCGLENALATACERGGG
jgi:DNA primase